MKTSTQLKALIRNLSREKKIEAHILMRNYMLERFLERISLSPYKNNFILKGGMLVAAMVGIDARATMDMDATIKGYPLSEEKIKPLLEEIISIPIDDEVQMTIKSIGEIRDEAEYGGLRLSIETLFDGIRTPLKIDITAGDKIIPKEITYKFRLMFENRSIDILAYNLETVLAEKLETMIVRGITNTRMRDFYDMHILQKLYFNIINTDDLKSALQATAKERGSFALLPEGQTIINEVSSSKGIQSLWKDYQNKFSYAEEISWDEVVRSVNFLWKEAQSF